MERNTEVAGQSRDGLEGPLPRWLPLWLVGIVAVLAVYDWQLFWDYERGRASEGMLVLMAGSSVVIAIGAFAIAVVRARRAG